MSKLKNLFKGKGFMMALASVIGLGFALTPDVAFAAGKTITDIAGSAQGNFTALKELAFSFGYLVGVVLFVAGIWLVYKDSKQPGQDHAKKGFISILIGVALLVAPTLIGIMSNSVGVDEAEVNKSMKEDASF
ncbi:hypothetical protein [Vibrio owensii]|uniref:hypothetical protein n=1 Tax=Vibrio harveyi group TaxID=717610 RepID=UPI003CC5E80F